jgi:hypothetical protein
MRRNSAFAFLAILMLNSGLPLAAQAPGGTGTLRRFTVADFLFLNLQDPSLYPETSVDYNPANLLRMTDLIFTSHTTFDLSRTSTTSTRTDDTIGALGGTLKSEETKLSPSENLGLYVPLGSTPRSPRLGVRAAADLASRDKLDSYDNYRSFSEKLTLEEKEQPFNAHIDLGLGMPTTAAGLGLGFALGYGYGYLPAVFPVQVDQSLNPVLTSYGIPLRQNDSFTHIARGTVGANLSLSRAAELSLALAYTGRFVDAAQSYVAIDTDSDGRNDTKLLYSDWIVSKEGVDKGGPTAEEVAISYSQMDLSIGTELSLAPRIRLYVSDTAELFLGGRYFILLMSDRTQYKRPIKADDIDGNQSTFQQYIDANFKSFDATLGLGLATARDAYLKVGVTYKRMDQAVKQNGTQKNGDGLYSTRNPDHYTELTLGLEPTNNAIVSLLDRPTLSLSQSLTLLLGWSYIPTGVLGVFLGGSVQGALRSDTYKAYNLDTRSVWEETVASQSIQWTINPVAGLRLRVSDSLSLGISATGTGIEGSLTSANETAPFNLELQKTTLNGTQDRSSSSPLNVLVQFDLTAVL